MVLAQGFILFLEMLKFSKKIFSQRNLSLLLLLLFIYYLLLLFIIIIMSDEDYL